MMTNTPRRRILATLVAAGLVTLGDETGLASKRVYRSTFAEQLVDRIKRRVFAETIRSGGVPGYRPARNGGHRRDRAMLERHYAKHRTLRMGKRRHA
jgi:hypothetical protein